MFILAALGLLLVGIGAGFNLGRWAIIRDIKRTFAAVEARVAEVAEQMKKHNEEALDAEDLNSEDHNANP